MPWDFIIHSALSICSLDLRFGFFLLFCFRFRFCFHSPSRVRVYLCVHVPFPPGEIRNYPNAMTTIESTHFVFIFESNSELGEKLICSFKKLIEREIIQCVCVFLNQWRQRIHWFTQTEFRMWCSFYGWLHYNRIVFNEILVVIFFPFFCNFVYFLFNGTVQQENKKKKNQTFWLHLTK